MAAMFGSSVVMVQSRHITIAILRNDRTAKVYFCFGYGEK
jgi:hypothetical protein